MYRPPPTLSKGCGGTSVEDGIKPERCVMTDFDGRSSHLWSLRQRKARRTTPEMLRVGSTGIKRSAWPVHPVQTPSTANILMPMSSMTNTSAGHPNKAVTRQFRARVTALNSPYRTRFIALYPPLVLKVTMASSFERLRQYQPCLPSKAASRTPSSPVDWRPLP